MIQVGLELRPAGLVAVVEARVGQGVLLEVLAAGAEEEEEDRGAGDRRMGIALGTGETGGTVADLGHHSPACGGKFHAPTKRPLGVPRMDGTQRLERRLQGWGRRSL